MSLVKTCNFCNKNMLTLTVLSFVSHLGMYKKLSNTKKLHKPVKGGWQAIMLCDLI